MALQQSINEIEGTIRNLTYYRRGNKFFLRAKSSMTKEKYYANERMLRPKLNNNEFGYAARSCKTIRHAINELLCQSTDTNMIARLNATLLKVVKTDTINDVGERKIEKGNLSLLKGFNMNLDSSLDNIFPVQYQSSINRNKGSLLLNVAPFDISQTIRLNPFSNYFRIRTACIEVDFNLQTAKADIIDSEFIPCNQTTARFNHQHTFSKQSGLPLILFMSVEFYQQTNGELVMLKNREFNPRTIIDTSLP